MTDLAAKLVEITDARAYLRGRLAALVKAAEAEIRHLDNREPIFVTTHVKHAHDSVAEAALIVACHEHALRGIVCAKGGGT